MANVNQAKLILIIFCFFIVMQSSACESKRQSHQEQLNSDISLTLP